MPPRKSKHGQVRSPAEPTFPRKPDPDYPIVSVTDAIDDYLNEGIKRGAIEPRLYWSYLEGTFREFRKTITDGGPDAIVAAFNAGEMLEWIKSQFGEWRVVDGELKFMRRTTLAAKWIKDQELRRESSVNWDRIMTIQAETAEEARELARKHGWDILDKRGNPIKDESFARQWRRRREKKQGK